MRKTRTLTSRSSLPRAEARCGWKKPRRRRASRRPTWCRKAACSGTAAPTRCRIRHCRRLLDPREMDGGSIAVGRRKIAARALRAAFRRAVRDIGMDRHPAWQSARRCLRWHAIRSKSQAFIPIPASSTTGWKAKPASPPPSCAAICCSTIRPKPIAAVVTSTSPARRLAAAVHRSSVRSARRTAQYRACRQ